MIEYAVLAGRVADGALLVRDRDHLPVIQAAPEVSTPDLATALRQSLGIEPTLLRIAQCRGAHDEPTYMAVELDNIDAPAPDGMAWLPLAEVEVERFDPPEVRLQVAYWLAWQREGPTDRRPPWARSGWIERASTWMTDRMTELGHPAASTPRLHYLWSISAVLTAETADGSAMFMKGCAPVFPAEAMLTQVIAARSPSLTVDVLAIEPTENWLLMADHGGRDLGVEQPITWVTGLDAFATIQRAWEAGTDQLIRAGASRRPLDALADKVPNLLDRSDGRAHLGPDDVAAIEAAIPELADACRRLEVLGPAPTVVHGDLHPWNLAVGRDGPIVFDWSDAAISHPFVDLAVFLGRYEDPEARRAARDAYLARWADVEDRSALEDAAALGLVVGALYQVDSYITLLDSLDPEDRYDMASAPGYWLSRAVKVLRGGIDAAGGP